MNETCGNCRFYKPLPGKDGTGDCTAHPPSVYYHYNYKDGRFDIGSASPPVLSEEWCGEWKLNWNDKTPEVRKEIFDRMMAAIKATKTKNAPK